MDFTINAKTDRLVIGGCIAALITIGAIFLLTRCSNQYLYVEGPLPEKQAELPKEEPILEPEEPEDLRTGAFLTGLPIDDDYLYRRPFAVMINNSRASWPHSGVASADIIYEALVEGADTRLMAVFQSEIPDKIGPVRSVRDYYVDMALNHDAVIVFHGSSPGGMGRVQNIGIDHFDGMALEGTTFWRDQSQPYWWQGGWRGLEHSSFTGATRLFERVESWNTRDEFSDDRLFRLHFGEIPEDLVSIGHANRFTVPFSTAYPRTFVFDEAEGHYLVENFNGAMLDAETRTQVAVANVLIQLTSVWVADNVGRQAVTTVGSGTGYFATGGEVFAVRWEKAAHNAPMRWYFENGEPIVLTPGRTWINVIQSYATINFE